MLVRQGRQLALPAFSPQTDIRRAAHLEILLQKPSPATSPAGAAARLWHRKTPHPGMSGLYPTSPCATCLLVQVDLQKWFGGWGKMCTINHSLKRQHWLMALCLSQLLGVSHGSFLPLLQPCHAAAPPSTSVKLLVWIFLNTDMKHPACCLVSAFS